MVGNGQLGIQPTASLVALPPSLDDLGGGTGATATGTIGRDAESTSGGEGLWDLLWSPLDWALMFLGVALFVL